MSWNGITPAWALVDPIETGGNLHAFMLTTEQVEMLDAILRRELIDYPEQSCTIPFRALYTKVQTTLANIGR